ncbi:unnamed protein product [Rhizoctonia solani]|uniref:Peptidase C14 caspase domain-containing protein n=1 Tax=Rhizoctonia solani TaxID=456999 RepID=A0A8H3DQK1_9AGAM|nr:unnamed protein product [Rhizoctonia solani]
MTWPDSGGKSMTLKGAVEDRPNAQTFLNNFTPGIRVEPLKNARREEIEAQIRKIQDDPPPLAVVYFQGHGEPGYGDLKYITDDRKEDGTLEGLTNQDMLRMFSKVNTRTTSMIITDFCYSGNLFRLQYCLNLTPDGNGFHWLETTEWKEDNKTGPKYRVASPMLHVAGSLEWQETFETRSRGGYLTNTLAKLQPSSLPTFLYQLRQGVDRHMKDAKAHRTKPLRQDATQVPQIFCSFKLPLDDDGIFTQLYPAVDEHILSES